MIRVEAVGDFSLDAFDKLKDIVRKNARKNEYGKLYLGDTFLCEKDMYEYLNGKNRLNKSVVKIIEVIPEEVKTEPKVVETTISYDTNKELKATFKPKKKKKK